MADPLAIRMAEELAVTSGRGIVSGSRLATSRKREWRDSSFDGAFSIDVLLVRGRDKRAALHELPGY